ncbi:MAG TPA: protein-disulfide reductase DsbD domain-containing protein [Stellaceae bacterium]|nr:protein-disulfide reductase DsbD domain-containing protein [Stellaceae bacterium]
MALFSTLGVAPLTALVAVLTAASPAHADGPPDPKDLVRAELVAEKASIAPAATLWVDLHLAIKPGWHVYWRNPGDSGLPTTIDWNLPSGFSAGAISWPLPEHFVQGGIGNYGYARSADLLVPITAPKTLVVGDTAVLAGKASWLACADICIPGGANVSLSLPGAAAPVAPDPAAATLFAAARRHLPLPAAFETRFVSEAHQYRLLVPEGALAGLRDRTGTFFPNDDSLIDHAAETHTSRRDGGLEIVLTKAATAAAAPATLDGVLALRGEDGAERAFEISANPAAGLPAEIGLAWWKALLLAFLGGVVLNAMPCVFPILSLKLLSLARQAHGHRSEQLGHGLAYTAGVLASFAALGTALLGLRGGGHAIGWGFQLQTPVFVAAIAYLLFAMGLSLSGVVSFGTGFAGAGGWLASRSGLTGTFFTGVLATIVATPCTAPFMGAALGFALIAPAALAIGIFLALGFGLAAPYLLATVTPGWQRVLPRSGAWMDLVKQLLAFPLYGTVAWLIWVLMQEAGPGGSLAALFGLVLVGFTAWIYGRTRLAAPLGRSLGTGFAVAGAAAAILLAASVTTTGEGTANAAPQERLAYEPFTAARLTDLEAAGKPVFVNLTASWCLTCLINERVALDSDAVRQAFTAHGIVALKGDWTSQNPEITALLQQFGRSGVPLYLLYDGKDDPVILPQILTAATVLDALGKV